jgi:phenylacetate-CoA ligase
MKTTPIEAWVARKTGLPSSPVSREHLWDYQLARLRDTFRFARQRSPFYQTHLAGLPQSGPSSLESISDYPFTSADDIRAGGLRFLCVSQGEISRVITLRTSGTTGEPKRLFFTSEEQESILDFFQVGLSSFSSPRDRVLVLLPCERPGSVGDLLAIGARRLGAEPFPYGLVSDYEEALRIIRDKKIDVVLGVPAQVLALARLSLHGGAKERLRLKSALLAMDRVPRSVRRAIEEAWSCQVFDHYGSTEMGFGGALECEAHAGYHLREADLYFEIVDPETGEVLPDGEFGEVVFTTLTRRGMPLIRYRTGDISRLLGEPCPCGTSLRRLDYVRERIGDAVPFGKGFLRLAELDEAVFSIDGVLGFDASVDRGGLTDCLRLDLKLIAGREQAASESVRARVESMVAASSQGKVNGPVVEIRLASIGGPASESLGKRVIRSSENG